MRRKFCSAKCRKAAWTARQEQGLALVLEPLTRARERLRAIRRPKRALWVGKGGSDALLGHVKHQADSKGGRRA